jgi:hypothetical protein
MAFDRAGGQNVRRVAKRPGPVLPRGQRRHSRSAGMVRIGLPAGNRRVMFATGIALVSLRRLRERESPVGVPALAGKRPAKAGTPANLDWQRECYAVLNRADLRAFSVIDCQRLCLSFLCRDSFLSLGSFYQAVEAAIGTDCRSPSRLRLSA